MNAHLRLFLVVLLCTSPVLGRRYRTLEEKSILMDQIHEEQKEHIRRALNEQAAVPVIVHYDDACGNPYHDFEGITNGHPMKVTEDEYNYMLENMESLCIKMIQIDGVVHEITFVTGSNSEAVKQYQDVADSEIVPYGISTVLGDNFPPSGDPPGSVVIGFCDSGMSKHSDATFGQIQGMSLTDEPWDQPIFQSKHGTEVVGTICATSYNGYGTRGFARCDRSTVRTLIGRVFPDGPSPETTTSKIDQCLQYMIENNAKVINLSLSTTTLSFNQEEIIANIVAGDKALIIAASGNGGSTAADVYPASFDGVVSVAAVDNNNSPASFTQSADVAAPGVDILTLSSGTGFEYEGIERSATSADVNALSVTINTPKCGMICEAGCPSSSSARPCQGAQDEIMLIRVCESSAPLTDYLTQCQSMSTCLGVIISYTDANYIYQNADMSFQNDRLPIIQIDQDNEGGILNAMQNGMAVCINFGIESFALASGTSIAAPLVTGVAAVLMQYRPYCKPYQIRQALLSTAIMPSNGSADLLGSGIVNGAAAYQYLLNLPSPCGNAAAARSGSSTGSSYVKSNPSDFSTTPCSGSGYRSRGCRHLRGADS
ncbi:hypothetical protein ACA910_007342 [Epithemia clementina (nom. ined.)]